MYFSPTAQLFSDGITRKHLFFSLFYHVLFLEYFYVSYTLPLSFPIFFLSCCPRCRHTKGISKDSGMNPSKMKVLSWAYRICALKCRKLSQNGCLFWLDFSMRLENMLMWRQTMKMTLWGFPGAFDRESSPSQRSGEPAYGAGTGHNSAFEQKFRDLVLFRSLQVDRMGLLRDPSITNYWRNVT